MKDKNHLPLLGPGPFYGVTVIGITVLFIILSVLGYMDLGKFNFLQIPFFIIGIILIIFGLFLWIEGAIISKIDKNIKENKLVTTGIYAYVRNPIYSAFLFVSTGVCFIFNNIFLLILPIFYYIFLTVLMILTEEKRLKELYDDEYIEYMRRVNRCIPFFPKNK